MGTRLAIEDQCAYNSKHTWFLANFFTGEDFRRITNANARQVKRPKMQFAQTPFPWVTRVTLNCKLSVSSVGSTSVDSYVVHFNFPDNPVYLLIQVSQWLLGKEIEVQRRRVRVVRVCPRNHIGMHLVAQMPIRRPAWTCALRLIFWVCGKTSKAADAASIVNSDPSMALTTPAQRWTRTGGGDKERLFVLSSA